ncbi:MAG: hypothetical protein HKN39_07030 [Flavobacteriales bacterium]|nr:hypothetical protein [Flavobacteriales bacterium]
MLLLLNCGSCSDPKPVSYDMNEIKKQIEEDSKTNAKREKKEIEKYVKNNSWEVKSTGTGLTYLLHDLGSGEKAKVDQIATIHYSIYLLNDSLCYSSIGKEPARFQIGKATVETGLHEALQLMRVGDKANFLLPSHLAHGTFGDRKKIPPQTPLRYDVELISLN